MRKLTPGQVRLLQKFPEAYCTEALDNVSLRKLIVLNNYETVLHDADRFLQVKGGQHVREF